MARIEKIDFMKVGRNEGCTCDKCGQYITNIWTVRYKGGVDIHFGMDCFDKMLKASKLNDYGMKLMKKTLKSIERHQHGFEAEKKLTEETDERYQMEQVHRDYGSQSAWYGSPWEEYHEWMLTVWWPARFKEDQENVDRFSKINFAD